MIYADKISLSFGQQDIFDEVSFSIQQDQKVGLVGRNGSGKSTLLRAVIDSSILDSGLLSYHKNKKIAYLPQNVVLESTRSILDETVRSINGLEKLLDAIEAIEQERAVASTQELLARQAEIEAELAEHDIGSARARAKRMLSGLGFTNEQFDQAVATLSVGWKMRVVLAKLLLQDADFYLFDEPTNHLDLIAKEWFLGFLKEASFGFMLVCHERYFLDELCTHILELERGRGIMYTGNYSKYSQQKAHNDQLLRAAYENQQKEIQRKKETIERFRAKASKAKMAQSMEKALSKIKLIALPPSTKNISFKFDTIKQSARTVLEVKNVSQQFGDKVVFKNVSCAVERGQKVAIIAANGVGKTTLLHIISGLLPVQSGSVAFGSNVNYALFAQDQNKTLERDVTILDNIKRLCPTKSEQSIRSFLGAFLFSDDEVKKKVGVLSGGEKNRVGMVSVLLHDANLLLLDEPTNHLDIESKAILLSALQEYSGTMVFVSHDRDFVNDLATHIIELTQTGAHLYHGNFDSYLYQKNQNTAAVSQNKPNQVEGELSAASSQKKDNKRLYALKKESNRLERMIAKREKDLSDLHTVLSGLQWGSVEHTAGQQKVSQLTVEVAELTEQWEAVHEELTG